MTPQQHIALLNANFNTLSKGRIYPFIGKNRITILEKGLYQKKNATYRGIGVVKDDISGKDKTILMGYYNVPEDMIIIPLDFIITPQLEDLVERYKLQGYKVMDKGFPQLQVMEFGPETLEHICAMKRKEEYTLNMKEYDSLNN
jgi:hypothetical protein